MDFSYDNLGFGKIPIRNTAPDLPKDHWPKLLTEVSFHMNAMKNATNRISPYLLTYERYPCTPLDAFAIISVTVRLILIRNISKH